MKPDWKNVLTWAAIVVITLALWGSLVFWALAFIPSDAKAQTGGFVFSPREASQPHGEYIVGWNTTGSTIYDGTLVMADTSGATSVPQVAIGKGFKTWNHSATRGDQAQILGVLMGNVPGYAQGRILVLGFHPWVKVDAAGITAKTSLRPSLVTTTNGAMGSWALADTANMMKPRIGIFQRYANAESLRAYVWVNTVGVMGGSR